LALLMALRGSVVTSVQAAAPVSSASAATASARVRRAPPAAGVVR
jgi:hypothetical protein